MTQNFFIILFLMILVASMAAMVLRDIYGPARARTEDETVFDGHPAQAEIEVVAPVRVLTSCDITKVYDIRDVDFGK